VFLSDSTVEGPVRLASRSLGRRLTIRVVRVGSWMLLVISKVLATCCWLLLVVSALESGDHRRGGLLGRWGTAPFLRVGRWLSEVIGGCNGWHCVVHAAVAVGRSTVATGCSAEKYFSLEVKFVVSLISVDTTSRSSPVVVVCLMWSYHSSRSSRW
jgi:hypothetical protein